MAVLIYFAIAVVAAIYAWNCPVTRYGTDGKGRLEVVGRLITTTTFFLWPLALPILILLHVGRNASRNHAGGSNDSTYGGQSPTAPPPPPSAPPTISKDHPWKCPGCLTENPGRGRCVNCGKFSL